MIRPCHSISIKDVLHKRETMCEIPHNHATMYMILCSSTHCWVCVHVYVYYEVINKKKSETDMGASHLIEKPSAFNWNLIINDNTLILTYSSLCCPLCMMHDHYHHQRHPGVCVHTFWCAVEHMRSQCAAAVIEYVTIDRYSIKVMS